MDEKYVAMMELCVAKGIAAKDSFLSVNRGPGSLMAATTFFENLVKQKYDQNQFQLKKNDVLFNVSNEDVLSVLS